MFKARLFVFLVLGCLGFSPAEASEVAVDFGGIERSVVAICGYRAEPQQIRGSGFFVASDGTIVTADHVIVDRKQNRVIDPLYCIWPDHPQTLIFPLRVVRRFTEERDGKDVAILRIASEGVSGRFPFLRISEACEIGDRILIAGFPDAFGKGKFWPLFRQGMVASTRYGLENSSARAAILDLRSVPGFSGSPVIDLRHGAVIGVFTGSPRFAPDSDFSVATLLQTADLPQETAHPGVRR
jgi:S1-C subfamily serine protease